MALPFNPRLQASQQLPQQAASSLWHLCCAIDGSIFPMEPLAPAERQALPMVPLAPAERQHLPDGAQPQRPGQQQLRHSGYPASNKPHLAEKSTPVWLAIWRTWAGFANSQLLPDAAALSSMQGLPWSGNSSAQTSASLHPSRSASLAGPSHSRGHGRPRSVRKSYRLREKCLFTELLLLRHSKSLGPSAPIAYATSVSPPNEAVAWPCSPFLQFTARANPCSRHLCGTLARAVASI